MSPTRKRREESPIVDEPTFTPCKRSCTPENRETSTESISSLNYYVDGPKLDETPRKRKRNPVKWLPTTEDTGTKKAPETQINMTRSKTRIASLKANNDSGLPQSKREKTVDGSDENSPGFLQSGNTIEVLDMVQDPPKEVMFHKGDEIPEEKTSKGTLIRDAGREEALEKTPAADLHQNIALNHTAISPATMNRLSEPPSRTSPSLTKIIDPTKSKDSESPSMVTAENDIKTHKSTSTKVSTGNTTKARTPLPDKPLIAPQPESGVKTNTHPSIKSTKAPSKAKASKIPSEKVPSGSQSKGPTTNRGTEIDMLAALTGPKKKPSRRSPAPEKARDSVKDMATMSNTSKPEITSYTTDRAAIDDILSKYSKSDQETINERPGAIARPPVVDDDPHVHWSEREAFASDALKGTYSGTTQYLGEIDAQDWEVQDTARSYENVVHNMKTTREEYIPGLPMEYYKKLALEEEKGHKPGEQQYHQYVEYYDTLTLPKDERNAANHFNAIEHSMRERVNEHGSRMSLFDRLKASVRDTYNTDIMRHAQDTARELGIEWNKGKDITKRLTDAVKANTAHAARMRQLQPQAHDGENLEESEKEDIKEVPKKGAATKSKPKAKTKAKPKPMTTPASDRKECAPQARSGDVFSKREDTTKGWFFVDIEKPPPPIEVTEENDRHYAKGDDYDDDFIGHNFEEVDIKYDYGLDPEGIDPEDEYRARRDAEDREVDGDDSDEELGGGSSHGHGYGAKHREEQEHDEEEMAWRTLDDTYGGMPAEGGKPSPEYEEWHASCEAFFNPATDDQTAAEPRFPTFLASKAGHFDGACVRAEKLKVCHHDLMRVMKGSKMHTTGEAWVERLKVERLRWHPDKFARRMGAMGKKWDQEAKEMFQLLQALITMGSKKARD